MNRLSNPQVQLSSTGLPTFRQAPIKNSNYNGSLIADWLYAYASKGSKTKTRFNTMILIAPK